MKKFSEKKQYLVVRGLLEYADRILIMQDTDGNEVSLEYFDLPGGIVEFGKDPVAALVDLFLATPYTHDKRHTRRIALITKYEKDGEI